VLTPHLRLGPQRPRRHNGDLRRQGSCGSPSDRARLGESKRPRAPAEVAGVESRLRGYLP
jgi:hypothetical protein